jgi:hypothetical protein
VGLSGKELFRRPTMRGKQQNRDRTKMRKIVNLLALKKNREAWTITAALKKKMNTSL